MKTKVIQSVPAVLALSAIGFRYFSNWCIDASSCYGTWVHQIALEITKPLFFFVIFCLPITLILIFVPRNIFSSWLKFAIWAIPVLLLFISTQPVYSGFLSTDRDDAARLAGEVFAGVSLVLIVWKSVVARRT